MSEEEKKPETNVEPWMKDAFEAISSGEYNNFALFSCFCNGEPTAAIVVVDRHGSRVDIRPLFVAVTPDMILEDHNGTETMTIKDIPDFTQNGDKGDN